jgi:1-deoxy-D-xylulose-5-phosphate reductoisomerase
MVEMIDGSVIAQLGVTDMRHAIQYALTYPERHECALAPLDLTRLGTLHFEAPDPARFPCIALAYRAMRAGGTLPAALNAANEEAVGAFLDGRIRLTDIARIIESVMDTHETRAVESLEIVKQADNWARVCARVKIAQMAEAVGPRFEKSV